MGVIVDTLQDMVTSIFLALALFSGYSALPTSPNAPCVEPGKAGCGPVADRLTEAQGEAAEEKGAAPEAADEAVDLMESEDEAIGDRIMEDMNGMKEKFDVALKRIGDEIDKDQQEQNEKMASK